MTKFDFDPGLTVSVWLADVEPLESSDPKHVYASDVMTAGTMVVVTSGTFKGLVGHTHTYEGLHVTVRQGTPLEWAGR